MIEIEAGLDSGGIIKVCKASGHAGAGKTGTDIVCAAVSVLFKTALNVLSEREGIVLRGGAPEKGQLWLETEYNAKGKDFLFAVGEFLIYGLLSVAEDYPDNCKLTIRNL